MRQQTSIRSVVHAALSSVVAACGQAAVAQGASVPPATTPQTNVCINSIGVEFVRIPAGNFMMGSSESDREASASEKPRHPVTISRPFCLARFELTQAQWEAVMGGNPYTLSRSNPYYNLPGMAARITKPAHPATVSWNDAQDFIRRLNEKEAVAFYRLPTEAEWEYAARAGTATAYSFGDDASQLGRHAWHGENFATGGTHPVGQKPANPWGLHDIHGNVWEWVQDRYDPDYYASSPPGDPQGPSSGNQRVVRGGSWHSTGDGWRSAFRRGYEADYRGISIGLRLVREIDAAP